LGIVEKLIQDNHSRSQKYLLRGLHFTKNKPKDLIVKVIRGKVFDVVVDFRKDSPTLWQLFGVKLSDEDTRQFYMPHGFSHGFCVLSYSADLHYKVSQSYNPADNSGLIWNDDQVKIDWPVKSPIISKRDLQHPNFFNLKLSDLKNHINMSINWRFCSCK
jgi:dTDP-4-dehydrorhamnose 3,5-epimerase